MKKFLVNMALFETKEAAIKEADRIFAKYGILLGVEEVFDG